MSDRTLLLVEDDPQDEFFTLRALKRAGVCNRIDVVRDGQQALDYLFCRGDFSSRSGSALPAVVLLDIGLPKISGLDVLTRLREEPSTRHVPVVILTSSDEPTDLVRSYQNGANSFVRKPVQFAEFARTVARLGVYWLATNEPCAGQ